jgi:hypothetical protein
MQKRICEEFYLKGITNRLVEISILLLIFINYTKRNQLTLRYKKQFV